MIELKDIKRLRVFVPGREDSVRVFDDGRWEVHYMDLYAEGMEDDRASAELAAKILSQLFRCLRD